MEKFFSRTLNAHMLFRVQMQVKALLHNTHYTWEVQQGRKGSSVTKKKQGRNTVTRKKKLSSDKEEKAQQ